MEGWKQFIGKTVKVIFQDGVLPDGRPSYKSKIGILDSVSATHLFIIIDTKLEALNLSQVLRVEPLRGDK